MIQEEKELLLKDLCARLPYGVKCKGVTTAGGVNTIKGHCDAVGKYDFFIEEVDGWFSVSNIVPYLRPMSSMTEEEKKEFINASGYEIHESINGRHYEYYLLDYVGTKEAPLTNADSIDWLNAHHFDYRGLIEKSLALEAPDYMYNFENND